MRRLKRAPASNSSLHVGALAALALSSFTSSGPAQAEACICQAAAPDPCVVGTWSIAASELNGIYENLMAGSALSLSWSNGSVDVRLDRRGTYAFEANKLKGSVSAGSVDGFSIGMSGAGETIGAYCTSAGKLCFTESSNSVTFRSTVPGSDSVVFAPVPVTGMGRASELAYRCSAGRLNVTIDAPSSGFQRVFELRRTQ